MSEKGEDKMKNYRGGGNGAKFQDPQNRNKSLVLPMCPTHFGYSLSHSFILNFHSAQGCSCINQYMDQYIQQGTARSPQVGFPYSVQDAGTPTGLLGSIPAVGWVLIQGAPC